ncbi:MAG TPA: IPT/TIG domain-containing protein [Acidimicrobiales bacterium]|nr:IPT/TIG domain-containing protein [Acidimicrobiales bacterium]
MEADLDDVFIDTRLLAVERRLRRLTLAVVALAVAVVGVGVAAIVTVVTYQPSVHIATGSLSGGATTSPAAVPASPPAVLSVHPASGPVAGGNKVVVLGMNLATAKAVLFGGEPGSGIAVNAAGTQLTVVAPAAGAGTVDVVVTTGRGTSDLSPSDRYSYLTPSVTRIRPSSALAGSQVTITGADLQGATGVLFGSAPAPSFTVDPGGTRILAVAPVGVTGPVPVVVLSPSGSLEAGTITLLAA